MLRPPVSRCRSSRSSLPQAPPRHPRTPPSRRLAPTRAEHGVRGSAELYTARQPGATERIVVLPGNPGCPSFYARFADALRDRTRAEVTVLGLEGHTTRTPRALRAAPFSLEEQEAWVLAFLLSLPAPVTLVGHSIGAHLALRAAAAAPGRVRSVLGLFPFLQLNAESRLQRTLGRLVRLRPLVYAVAAAAQLFSLLPLSARVFLLRPPCSAAGLDEEALRCTAEWLRWRTVVEMCHLGAKEFDAFAGWSGRPQWAAVTCPVTLYYGEGTTDDIWGPPHHAVAARAAGVCTAHGPEGHMFCTQQGSSESVAVAAAALLAAMARESAPAEAPAV